MCALHRTFHTFTWLAIYIFPHLNQVILLENLTVFSMENVTAKWGNTDMPISNYKTNHNMLTNEIPLESS